MSTPNRSAIPNCSCGCSVVLHAIRGNGSRGACSNSNGPKAVPCGCKAYAAAEPDDGGLFTLPDQPQTGGQHL